MNDDQTVKYIIKSDVNISQSSKSLKSKIVKKEYAGTEINNLMTDCVKAGLDKGKELGHEKIIYRKIEGNDWDSDKVYPSGSLKD